MWRYGIGAKASVDEVWGLSGFSEPFIGDATNTNQIEHMTISALAQMVLGIPAIVLDMLEEMEWILRKGTYAASQADKRVEVEFEARAELLLNPMKQIQGGYLCAMLDECMSVACMVASGMTHVAPTAEVRIEAPGSSRSHRA